MERVISQDVAFKNSRGSTLCATLSEPEGHDGNFAVIHLHGLDSSRKSATSMTLENILPPQGVPLLVLDFFGHGSSEGNFEDITLSEGIDDALRAEELMNSRGYSELAIIGSSYGGAAALNASRKMKSLKGLFLKSPVSNYLSLIDPSIVTKWEKEGWAPYREKRINFGFYKDLKDNNYNAHSFAKEVQVPALVVHGTGDEMVPLEQSKRLVSLVPHAELKEINGADHHYSHREHFDEMMGYATSFALAIRNGVAKKTGAVQAVA